MAGTRRLTLLIVLLGAGGAWADDPTGAVTIRWIHPDRQVEQVLALFQGARAPHPAAALSAWRCATRDAGSLGKPIEGLIALFNPEMVREFRSLDEAKVGIGIDPATGQIRWYAVAPNDDGTFASVATALVLTEGGAAPPFEGIGVDRLGPDGAALLARVPGVLTLVGSREDLPEAIRQAGADVLARPDVDSGLCFHLDPRRLATTGSVPLRRIVEAVRGLELSDVEGLFALRGDAVALTLSSRFEKDQATGGTLDPAWLEWLPAEGVQATFAVALDSKPESWDAAFAWADRIDRADPARAQVAPLRTRLNLLAITAGVRLEVDLWPKLRGVSGYSLSDAEGRVVGGLLALHLVDEGSAQRLATEVLPRAVNRLSRGKPKEAPPASLPDGAQWLGTVSERPLSVLLRGSTLLVGWGETTLSAALAAKARPEHSAAVLLKGAPCKTTPRRAAAFWPGGLGSSKLSDAPPVVWWGWDEKGMTHDVVRWEGLHGVVVRYLERLPLQPPTDH